MPIELTSLSQSSLQDYFDCPRRFELRYLQKISYPAIETEPALENEKHQREGENFHRLVQQFFIGIPEEQISKLANTDNLANWWENFTSAKDLSGLKNLSGVRTEITLSAPLGPFRLVAKYDLIAFDAKKFRVYDWKTYRKRPKSDLLAIRFQTRVYRALLVQAGAFLNGGKPINPEQIEMIYWFSNFPNDPAHFSYTSDQFKRDWDALLHLAEEIKNASNYPKTEEIKRCLYCPYRSYCNRGIGAGDALDVEIESEEEEEEVFEINFDQVSEIEF
ncbi:MAG: PD-(D/E)XK nuclease family protein [Anaerolineales bacterium]|nr:PD-(D/E)XK nuclease family protein [Anaerolineales bacterium]